MERPTSCPICGERSVEEITRTHSERVGDNVTKSSGVIGYRCGRGHLFLSIRLMHEKPTSGHEGTGRGNHAEIIRGERQKMLNALRLLFDLLEDYSPLWYTKKHHDQADEALHRR